jgi:hypothetical protein
MKELEFLLNEVDDLPNDKTITVKALSILIRNAIKAFNQAEVDLENQETEDFDSLDHF